MRTFHGAFVAHEVNYLPLGRWADFCSNRTLHGKRGEFCCLTEVQLTLDQYNDCKILLWVLPGLNFPTR